MHPRLVLSFALALMLSPDRAQAQTAVSVAAQIGDFHLAVSNYYHVPEREVLVIRERRVSDDELPVVLFVAQRARVSPMQIVDLRVRGLSWWDISARFGIGPEVYYVPMTVAPGPPYGRAYGHYKKPKHQWNTIVLSDADVVNLVHLRFLSDHYHVSPERVIELRGHQGDVRSVNAQLSRHRSDGRHDEGHGANGRGPGKSGHP